MQWKFGVRLIPIFLGLVALQAILVVVQRTNMAGSISPTVMGGVRLGLAVLILILLAFMMIGEWKTRREAL